MHWLREYDLIRLLTEHKVFLVVAIGWFFSVGIRYLFPALLPELRTTFDLDLTTAGLLVSVLWGAYAVGQFPSGILGDAIGGRNILALSTALTIGTVVAIALSFNAITIFLAAILFGLASALYGPTRMTIYSSLYPNNTGTAVATTMAVGNFANTILPIIAGILATYYTWRLGFAVLIPFLVVVTVAIWVIIPEDVVPVSDGSSESIAEIVRNAASAASQKAILVMGSVQICASFVSNGFKGLFPLFLIETKGISPVMATTLYGLLFGVAIFIQPAVGVASDRFGSKPTLLVISVVTGSGLVAITMVDELLYVVALTVVLGSVNGFSPVTQAHLTDVLPTSVMGSGLGLIRTCFILLGSTGPILVGWLADSGYFEESFVLLGLIALVPIVLLSALDR